MNRLLIVIAAHIVWPLCLAMAFEPPTAAERLQAIGLTDSLSGPPRRAFDPANDFEPIPRPNPGDWLAVHREAGQTFGQFVESKSNRPDKIRNKLYLLPLGEFPTDRSPSVERLKEYAAAFFAMPVNIMPPLPLEAGVITTRINPHTRKRQLLTGDVLQLLKQQLPPDAFCLLGITIEDLYPDPSWNFVFGQTSLGERVAVYSFARYDPAFYRDSRGKDYAKILLRRSCKVLAHETAHMFGLQHCIYFHCLMNGSNHLDESDARPMHLCPVCLHKLQYSVGFDVAARYRTLLQFHKEAGFDDEVQWIERRLKHVTASN